MPSLSGRMTLPEAPALPPTAAEQRVDRQARGLAVVDVHLRQQRELAEHRLRETQSMLHMAAQVGRLGAWAFDRESRSLSWSADVNAIYEVPPEFAPTPEQAIGFCVPEHHDRLAATFRQCVLDGTPFDTEVQITTGRGRRLWVRIICEAQWDSEGHVRSLQGAVQDISASRQVAEDARQLADQLTMTLESITDAFLTMDRDWRFTYVNSEAEHLLQRPRNELLGKVIWLEFPELLGSNFQYQYQRAVAENVSAQFEAFHEPLGLWLQVRAFPSPQGLAVSLRDITGRVQAEREILRLNAELEERVRQRTAQLEAANRELESFAYSIAHDLRAPLGSIDGFSRMLETAAGQLIGGRNRHYLTRIRAGVRQMSDQTDGLLSLASLSRATLRKQPVDLAPLVHEALDVCRGREPQRDVTVTVQERMPVHGDARLLRQVVAHLVFNAWKFTGRKPDAAIEVGTEAGPQGTPVHFVRDNGAGFDPAYAGRLFEPFQRMHPVTDFEGTGIGLAAVQKIVSRHGGKVWADAEPERGATFYFTLPGLTPLA